MKFESVRHTSDLNKIEKNHTKTIGLKKLGF